MIDAITAWKLLILLFTFISGGVAEHETKIITATIYPSDNNKTEITIECEKGE